MKLDRSVQQATLEEIAAATRQAEIDGYHAIYASEVAHDPFLPLTMAAANSQELELMTCIAVAFARNPMTLAVTAHDLHRFSGERFVLGLGSQIKAHIERRFSMPWSQPAARMRELILAIRAIWRAWDQGERLDFRGDFYSHTLMTPNFEPGANASAPRVFLAGVGERMTEVAGEVGDGFFCHAFTTPEYLRTQTIPALERGLAAGGRPRQSFEISAPVFVATGADQEQIAARTEAIRGQIAFYASTPAYRPVLDLHGWGALGDELRELTRRGRWNEMAGLVEDDVLHRFAVVATPEQLPNLIAARYGGLISRMSFETPAELAPDRKRQLLRALAAI